MRSFFFSKNAIVLTDLTVLASSTRRALAHVSSLRQDITSGTVLAGLTDARIQRFLAVSTSELRWTYTPIVRRLVLLHRVIAMVIIFLVLELGIVIAFPRVLLCPSLVDRRAVGTPAPNYVHSAAFAVATSVVPAFTPLL